MPISCFVLYLSILLTPSKPIEDILHQFPLVFLSVHAKEILQAKFIADDNLGAYMVTRKFGSSGTYADTILYRGHTSNLLSNQGVRYAVPFDNKEAEEFLIFATEIQGNGSIKHVYGPGFMKYHNRIYVVTSEYIDERIHYRLILDSLVWSDFLLRVDSITMKTDALPRIKELPDKAACNKALFAWLENYFDTCDPACGLYDVCNWNSIPDKVIHWIAQSGVMEDAWLAGEFQIRYDSIHSSRISCREKGYFIGAGTTFQNPDGIHFLLEKSLDIKRSCEERTRALTLLRDAVMGLYDCESVSYKTPCKLIYPELQSQLLEQLTPHVHDEIHGRDVYYVIENLSTPVR